MAQVIQAGSCDTDTSLASLPVGAHARVLAISGTGQIARRLMEMGLVPGAHVRVVKAAPLGDPLEVRVRGYHLALRRAEAQTIKVITNGHLHPTDYR
jgi:Fe2+ transport system protein FeoA